MKFNKKITLITLSLLTLFSCQTTGPVSSTSQEPSTNNSSTILNQTSSSTQANIQTFTDTEKRDLLDCFNLEIPFLNVGNKTNYKLDVQNIYNTYGYII